jgi:hypothetical protein
MKSNNIISPLSLATTIKNIHFPVLSPAPSSYSSNNANTYNPLVGLKPQIQSSSCSNFFCADTGSTNILLRLSDLTAIHSSSESNNTNCDHNIVVENPISVRLPNGAYIQSMYSRNLYLDALSSPLRVYVFSDQDLKTSLLSISEFCNAGCIATFTANDVVITNQCNGNVVAVFWS